MSLNTMFGCGDASCVHRTKTEGTDCTENAKAIHKIPLDLVIFNGKYQEIVEEILEW